MIIEQIYTGCLAQATYYIESEGEVAIIDPLREVNQYIEKAKINKAKITYIFETHFHADFVSGHVTLSNQTGAPIIYGPNAETNFESISAKDGQTFKVGKLTITVLHTPGHTMESSVFLLRDKNDKEHAIFTGDTLFLGDVGRPDLAQKTKELTEKDLAGFLFDSLQTKIMPLPDDVLVYPAHGAGSSCGKNLSRNTVDTLGNQKKINYALRSNITKEEFIEEVIDGLLPPPLYFPLNIRMNKEGYEDVEDILKKSIQAYSSNEFERIANETNAVILDVRHQDEFSKGHIPNSIFIGLDGGFAPWVGALIANVTQPILLVVPEGREKEAIKRLSRVGFDNVLGYLDGCFKDWKKRGKEFDTIKEVTAKEFIVENDKKGLQLFDVRKEGEYASEHIITSKHTPLNYINEYLPLFKKDSMSYVHCAGGYRSIIAISILKSRGIQNLINIKGGFKSLKEEGAFLAINKCSTTS